MERAAGEVFGVKLRVEEDEGKVINIEVDKDINPSHYHDAGIEPIEYMRANFSPEAYKGFIQGNIIKYVSRYEAKNGIGDLKKARNYLDMLIKTLEESE